jgi:predicted phage tail protein
MSILTAKTPATRHLDRKVKEAKAALRELQETLEDLEDRLDLAKAIAENAGKPLIPWEIAAKDLGIKPPLRKHRRKIAQK